MNLTNILKKKARVKYKIKFWIDSIEDVPKDNCTMYVKWQRGKKWKEETIRKKVSKNKIIFNQNQPFEMKCTLFKQKSGNSENIFKEKSLSLSLYETSIENNKSFLIAKIKVNIGKFCVMDKDSHKFKESFQMKPMGEYKKKKIGKKISISLAFETQNFKEYQLQQEKKTSNKVEEDEEDEDEEDEETEKEDEEIDEILPNQNPKTETGSVNDQNKDTTSNNPTNKQKNENLDIEKRKRSFYNPKNKLSVSFSDLAKGGLIPNNTQTAKIGTEKESNEQIHANNKINNVTPEISDRQRRRRMFKKSNSVKNMFLKRARERSSNERRRDGQSMMIGKEIEQFQKLLLRSGTKKKSLKIREIFAEHDPDDTINSSSITAASSINKETNSTIVGDGGLSSTMNTMKAMNTSSISTTSIIDSENYSSSMLDSSNSVSNIDSMYGKIRKTVRGKKLFSSDSQPIRNRNTTNNDNSSSIIQESTTLDMQESTTIINHRNNSTNAIDIDIGTDVDTTIKNNRKRKENEIKELELKIERFKAKEIQNLILSKTLDDIILPYYEDSTGGVDKVPIYSAVLFKVIQYYSGFSTIKHYLCSSLLKRLERQIYKSSYNNTLNSYWLSFSSFFLNIINKDLQITEIKEKYRLKFSITEKNNFQIIETINSQNLPNLETNGKKPISTFLSPVQKFKEKIKKIISSCYMCLVANCFRGVSKERIISSFFQCVYNGEKYPLRKLLKIIDVHYKSMESNHVLNQIKLQFLEEIVKRINNVLFNSYFDQKAKLFKGIETSIQLKMNLSQLEKWITNKHFDVNDRTKILAGIDPVKDICNILMMNKKLVIEQLINKEIKFQMTNLQMFKVFDVFNTQIEPKTIDSEIKSFRNHIKLSTMEIKKESYLLKEDEITSLSFANFHVEFKQSIEWEKHVAQTLENLGFEDIASEICKY